MVIWLRYLDRVVRGEATRPAALQNGDIEQPVGGLTVLGAIYGLCMGCYTLFQGRHASLVQAFATVIKVPALFFLTLAVTFPSLYVFNALVGSRLSLLPVLRLLVISLTVMLAVLASLGPIVAFFSASTASYPFMLLLNVAIFAVSGVLGLRSMLTALHRLAPQVATSVSRPAEMRDGIAETSIAPPIITPSIALDPLAGQPIGREVRTVFRIWIAVFGLVGAQMAWVLRPFLGSPERTFTWFRPRESSFFEAVFYAIHHLMR
jgi:hypothetical protein